MEMRKRRSSRVEQTKLLCQFFAFVQDESEKQLASTGSCSSRERPKRSFVVLSVSSPCLFPSLPSILSRFVPSLLSRSQQRQTFSPIVETAQLHKSPPRSGG